MTLSLHIDIADKEIAHNVREGYIAAIPELLLSSHNATYEVTEHNNALLLKHQGSILWQAALPIRMADLIQHSVSLMMQAHNHTDIDLGAWILQPLTQMLILRQDEANVCELTEKETALLAFLYKCGAQGAAKDAMMREVWGYHPDVETRTMDTHLYRLRQKLENMSPQAPQIIVEDGYYILKL